MTRGADDAFLRDRLMRFGVTCGALGLFALILRIPGTLYRPLVHGEGASFAWHGAAALSFLATALICRFAPLSRGRLYFVDAFALPLGSMCYGLMGQAIGPERGVRFAVVRQLIVILAMTYTVQARAIYVPSSGRRTALVTAACFPGILVVDCGDVPWIVAACGALMWWTITTIAATLASTVIFGLRSEVRAVRQYGQYTARTLEVDLVRR